MEMEQTGFRNVGICWGITQKKAYIFLTHHLKNGLGEERGNLTITHKIENCDAEAISYSGKYNMYYITQCGIRTCKLNTVNSKLLPVRFVHNAFLPQKPIYIKLEDRKEK